MNTATARVLLRGTSEGREFSHVLAGVLLDGEAARLAAALDPAFLDEAGWDPVRQVLEVPQIFRTGDPIGFSPERNGIKCRGKRTITLRSSRSRPSEKWSTPRRLGQSPKWRENSM